MEKGESGNMYHSVASSKMFNKNMAKINSVPFYDPHVNIQAGDDSPPKKRRKLEDMTNSIKKTGTSTPLCKIPLKKCQEPASTPNSDVCITPKKTQSPQLYLDNTGRTLQISILIMNLRKPRKYDVVKSSVFPMTGNVQNGISELKSHQ